MIELKPGDKERLIAFLRSNIETNIFLLAVLDRSEPGRPQLATDARFYALERSGEVAAVLYMTNGGLCVPYATDPADMKSLVRAVKSRLRPRLLVGPRAATDAVWDALDRPSSARLFRRHRLYVIRPGQLTVSGHAGVRLATARDLDRSANFAACMQSEELGLDPRQVDQTRFRHRVARLISNEQFYILPIGDTHAFQASASAQCVEGAQVEAVYVPPNLRGRGWATQGLAGMCEGLFTRFPLVTLHVNEDNHAAVRLYERLGFTADAAFRLISV